MTHTATVKDVLSHTNHLNPTDAQTLQETTTKYDERGRAVASTVWLNARGEVDPENPPIAGEGNVAATEGLTTKYRYDDDLDDGAGLDQEFSSHLTGLNLGANADGSARLVTNPAGERSLAISDGRGRSIKSVQLAADVTALVSQTQSYDAIVSINGYGDVLETSSANALGHTNKQRTDGAGRTIQSLDAENFITSFQYDANGNRLSVRDGNNVGQDCVYDALNRDQQCADTQELLDNVNRRKVFNLAGQVLQDIDAKNAITSSTYDARGRRVSTTDRINATTTFTFDAAGNELSMTDAENQTTSYSYDALNRRLTIQWPDHVAGTVPGDQHYGIQHTAYDAAGRALRKTDQRGATISLIYDLAGRMLRREYRSLANSTPLENGLPTGPVADQDVFTYDAASRMLTATKGRYSNTVAMTYDAGGRRASESLTFTNIGNAPLTYNIGYAYDAAGRENEITYPDGTVVQRAFTPRSQLQSVNLTEPGSNTALSVSTFEYDAGRRETSRTYGNGITTTRTYRADNMVSSINAPAVESLSYTYDVNKNPTSELRSGVMAPYSWSTGESGFDAQNRLTNWTRQNGDSQSWQLTAVNDWQSFTNNGVQQQRTHGPTHEIQSIDNAPLIHDSRGNLTQDNRGTSMTYDADNMLSVFGASAVEGLRNATYTYDALGRRVSKTVAGATANDPSTTTLFVLANQQVIAEYQSTSGQPPTLASRTAYGTYIDEPLILLSNLTSQVAYYHTNRQHSVYTLSDSTSTVLDRIAYTPYGEHYCFTATGTPRSLTPTVNNTTLFTGRTADLESAIHYFRARYFTPKLGRFLSHDPILYPDGRNTFAGWFSIATQDPFGRDVLKRLPPYDVKCSGQYWWKYSRGNDDLTAPAPWNENYQTAIMCVELDINAACKLGGGLYGTCCQGVVSIDFRFRAVQTGQYYPKSDQPTPNTVGFRGYTFSLRTDNPSKCKPLYSPLTLSGPSAPSDDKPWGQGTTLSGSMNCKDSCDNLSQNFGGSIQSNPHSSLISRVTHQTFSFGANRRTCEDTPSGYAASNYVPNSPTTRTDDMLRLIDASPSVGFVGPMQLPHDPQPIPTGY